MNNKVGVLLVFVAVGILGWGIFSIAELILIKNKGSQIRAKVLKVDTDCDRYNNIEVAFEDKIYSVSISRTDCQNRVYKVGQNVRLIKYKDYNTLIWPDAKVEWLPFVLLAAFVLGFYTNKEKFGKSMKPSTKKD